MTLVDTHHHCYFPKLISRLRSEGIHEMAPGVPLPSWSARDSVAMMDALGIDCSVASVILPASAVGIAGLDRSVNEWIAELIDEYRPRFGGLCSLPLYDVEQAVCEISHGIDELGLDGVVLPTVVDGHSVSDPRFEPVFAELNEREAVAFLHPTPGAHCSCMPSTLPPVVIDFVMDTTRTVADLIFGGTLRKYPKVKLIVAHAGGAIPYLTPRLELAAAWNISGAMKMTAPEIRKAVGDLYYEIAQSMSPATMSCLSEITAADHIMFGTDFPFIPVEMLAEHTMRPQASDATVNLFPRLGGLRALS